VSLMALMSRLKGQLSGVKRDKKARVTICLALSDSILATVRSCETALSVWEKLASIFESKSVCSCVVSC